MLILTRKIDQAIMMSNGVTVRILGVDFKYGRVKIGIDAPAEVSIMREELLDGVTPATLKPRQMPLQK